MRLQGTAVDDGTTVATLERGIQRGQWEPHDSCRSWGQYEDDVELDTPMTLARVAAALTIVVGALGVFGYLVLVIVFYKCAKRRWMQWMAAILALACSGFQAATHLMVQSEFCEDSDLVFGDICRT